MLEKTLLDILEKAKQDEAQKRYYYMEAAYRRAFIEREISRIDEEQS